MKNILVFGATSAIAQACARLWAARGDRLLLVARDPVRLEEVGTDLAVRAGAAERVATFCMDAVDTARFGALAECIDRHLPSVDIALIAHGTLPDQSECEACVAATSQALQVNGTSTVALMAELARRLERQGSGTLAVIGSPAGDRGRASNYTYGAAKAMVHTYAAGLRHRFAARGIRVVTIKPGFIDTPMTAAFDKQGPLWSTPARIAPGIVVAIDAGRSTLYTPWFWRWIMLVIRLVPEAIFVKTRL
jgi:decaprenylphospho-beta-D-erythro-pentofuranosid-2-ulose 2-reductase